MQTAPETSDTSQPAARAVSERLRILMISPQYPPIVGGYERAAERLAMALVRKGHSVTVVAERRERAWLANENSDGVAVRRLFCLAHRRLHMATYLPALLTFLLINVRRYDVIHIQQYGLIAAVAACVAAWLGRPTVLKITSTGEGGLQRTLHSHGPILTKVSTSAHRLIDAFIVTSSTAAEEVASFAPGRLVAFIPNGLQTSSFRPPSKDERAFARRALGLENRSIVLFVGRLSRPKNVTAMLQAWRTIHLSGTDAHLIVAGDGPERASAEMFIAREGLGSSVTLMGKVTDILPLYRAADIFVLPSLWEGLSNALLEAMSCGVAVISTAVSGSTDIFAAADIGEMVPVGDISALASAVVKLLSDPVRRRSCGHRASVLAAERFDIDIVTERTISLYRQLLRNHS